MPMSDDLDFSALAASNASNAESMSAISSEAAALKPGTDPNTFAAMVAKYGNAVGMYGGGGDGTTKYTTQQALDLYNARDPALFKDAQAVANLAGMQGYYQAEGKFAPGSPLAATPAAYDQAVAQWKVDAQTRNSSFNAIRNTVGIGIGIGTGGILAEAGGLIGGAEAAASTGADVGGLAALDSAAASGGGALASSGADVAGLTALDSAAAGADAVGTGATVGGGTVGTIAGDATLPGALSTVPGVVTPATSASTFASWLAEATGIPELGTVTSGITDFLGTTLGKTILGGIAANSLANSKVNLANIDNQSRETIAAGNNATSITTTGMNNDTSLAMNKLSNETSASNTAATNAKDITVTGMNNDTSKFTNAATNQNNLDQINLNYANTQNTLKQHNAALASLGTPTSKDPTDLLRYSGAEVFNPDGSLKVANPGIINGTINGAKQ